MLGFGQREDVYVQCSVTAAGADLNDKYADRQYRHLVLSHDKHSPLYFHLKNTLSNLEPPGMFSSRSESNDLIECIELAMLRRPCIDGPEWIDFSS